jgi:histidinol-phosphatase
MAGRDRASATRLRRPGRTGAPHGGGYASSVDDDLALALQFADAADAVSMATFRAHDLTVDTKADLSPVTAVDRDIEEMIRERLAKVRPQHTVLGEEFGGDRGGGEWQWVVDPIDGTRSYVRGNETWATLIALRHRGRSVLGVASAPAMRLRFQAARGRGALLNGRSIRVSRISRVEEAMITHTSVRGFVRVGLADRFTALAGRCWDGRGVGNALSHLLVARGSADIGWTSRANVWDFAALSLIVEEAGGRFTDRSGDDAVLGGTGISSNGLLHDQVLAAAGVQETA